MVKAKKDRFQAIQDKVYAKLPKRKPLYVGPTFGNGNFSCRVDDCNKPSTGQPYAVSEFPPFGAEADLGNGLIKRVHCYTYLCVEHATNIS